MRSHRPSGLCSICHKEAPLTRGLCEAHYQRWHRRGFTPEALKEIKAPVQRDYAQELDEAALAYADADDANFERLRLAHQEASLRYANWVNRIRDKERRARKQLAA